MAMSWWSSTATSYHRSVPPSWLSHWLSSFCTTLGLPLTVLSVCGA
ncbi:hypothetical protein PHMEG_0007907, partial [Phytophthora megakarya]